MRERNKRNITIGILCCLLVFMGVGFAVMNATLNINGTATAINTWDVRMTKIEVVEKSEGASNNEELTKINDDGITAAFQSDFTKPGDYITYEVTVENNGTIDAILNNISITLEVAEADKDLFNVEDNRPENELLAAGESTTFTIKVGFKSDADRMPSGDIEYTVKVDYSQQDEVVEGGEITEKTCDDGEINLAGECFHIMSEDDTSYTLLSKYNLLVGNTVIVDENLEPQTITAIDTSVEGYGLQNEAANGLVTGNTTVTGAIAFADVDESRKNSDTCERYGCYYGYWHDVENNTLLSTYGTTYSADVYDANSKVYEYVENYETYLKGKGYTSASARLMTYKEAEDLGCVGDDTTCEAASSWVYSTTYWLSSAYDDSSVWCIVSYGGIGYNHFDNDNFIGVRPVITILKSEI